jgi:hypothetical protein
MSASSPISLTDDDENDQHEHASIAAAAASTNQHPNEEAIQMFLQVMGTTDRTFAVAQLALVDYDVSRAVSLVFEKGETAVIERGGGWTNNTVDRSDHKPAFKSGAHQNDENKISPADKKLAVSPMTMQLSEEWKRCYEHSRSSGESFIDPDFPPNRSSLDGRKERRSTTASSSGLVKCLCGIPAAARTVQSDGPNYGRYYLACGQPRGRRHNRKPNSGDQTAQKQNQQPCKFFQWDNREGSRGANNAGRFAHLVWHAFGPPHCVLWRKQISPSQVRQGSVGNCWFLSALAVVAEKKYLVRQLLPHESLNESNCYQINLCLDGKWTLVIVDSSLPVVFDEDSHTSMKKTKLKGGVAVAELGNLVASPAFAAVPDGQLWPALVEKAYAKAHGSYAQLSGGFIAEALSDMTGAPTETIIFGSRVDLDELWARLMSFAEAGFLMGVATCRGGEGLVGNHAYSVLDLFEFHDSLVGAQQKVTDFFRTSASPAKKKLKSAGPAQADEEEDEVQLVSVQSGATATADRTSIRLVRIRNPWGTREWKGEWSASSEKWTTALRKRLGDQSYSTGDGTFFMSFADMLEKFHHMDVAKCREGWHHTFADGFFQRERLRSLTSSVQVYRIRPQGRTWAFISLIQPKKRANTKSQYWYADPSIIILKRKLPCDDWTVESSALHGCTRTCSCEIFLDPAFDYCVVPFSHHAEGSTGHLQGGAPFRLTAYSSAPVVLEATSRDHVDQRACLELLHRIILGVGHKLYYAVAPQGILACVHGQECLYFVVINAASDHYLSLRLTVQETKGLLFMDGTSQDTFDVPPRSQAILLVVSHSGTDSSAAASVTFTYASDIVPSKSSSSPERRMQTAKSTITRSSIQITLAGDLLASEVSPSSCCDKGGDTIETQLWLSQVGSSR